MDERTRADVERAEAAIVEHYPRLVRLAHLVLPPAMGRHRRVLTAHGIVQRALPSTSRERARAVLPGQRRGPRPEPGYPQVRSRVLELALAQAKLGRRRSPLPFVWGLRLFPRAGGADELALDQALSALTAPARAAVGLRHLEELDEDEVVAVLGAAGVADPGEAQRAAAALGPGTAALLHSGEFDPCTVQARPTDLLRRRQGRRVAIVGAAALTAGAALLTAVGGPGGAPEPARPDPATVRARQALDPERLVRAPDDAWADTSRMDFTAWSPRGEYAGDTALLGRALRVWGAPGRDVRVTAAAGTSTRPPDQPPRVLYGGVIDGVTVAVLHDGDRLVRYAEPEGAPAELEFARADNADLTTAGALVIGRGTGWMRYLIAPWITDATTRDLLRPGAREKALHVAPDGVTDRVPQPPADGAACGQWPVTRLHSSARVTARHSFLLTDLGDLTPVHLTYGPATAAGPAAAPPAEATTPTALLSWARTACSLREERGAGVRSVNNWVYARQRLPESGAAATWTCSRADTWRGPGRVAVQFHPAAGAARVVGRARDTAACSPYGPEVVGETRWRAGSGHWYLLAAGSSAVRGLDVTGAVHRTTRATTFAVAVPANAPVRVAGVLASGGLLHALRR
ncbi:MULTISPECIES: hypothetical protein [Streptomyces]|uniref:DNA-directed RNA polymerase specialized sigma24 family protein n=1 Tax=Streptomyces ramulosus TaxID=47762 RepID=A0ABW1FIX2_9ACTN